MIQRWCICEPLEDGRPAVAEHARAWRHRRELPARRLLVLAEFEPDGPELDAAQADARIDVLPSLTTPADRLSGRLAGRLAALGITPAPGDTILNILRALRTRFNFGFRVDLDS